MQPMPEVVEADDPAFWREAVAKDPSIARPGWQKHRDRMPNLKAELAKFKKVQDEFDKFEQEQQDRLFEKHETQIINILFVTTGIIEVVLLKATHHHQV